MLKPAAEHRTVAATEPKPRDAQGDASSFSHAPRAIIADVALHERTFKWLATLPAEVRPMATAREYPRIANRIGELWGNCEFSRLYMQGLLKDRRSGRKGFPSLIREELEALQTYYFENLSALPAVLWDAVPLHEPKIPHRAPATVPNNTEIEILAA
jgi:hypothetical protein